MISFSAISVILPLWVETERYIGRQVQDRRCRLSNQQTVESETHFLLECDIYDNIWNDMFHDIFDFNEYTFMNTIAMMNLLMSK